MVEQWLKLVDRFLLSTLFDRRVWNKDKKERMAVELVPYRDNLAVERPLAKVLRETCRGFSHPLIPSVTRYPSLYCVPLAFDFEL